MFAAIAPVILQTVTSMAMALVTKEMITKIVVGVLDTAVSAYESKAAKTPDKSDDAAAKQLRKILAEAKKAWGE